MTTQQHPITPPSKLLIQWEGDILNERDNVDHVLDCAWQNGFQAGADAELEACCEWVIRVYADDDTALALRTGRRPLPSLKEQALKAVQNIDDACESEGFSKADDTDIIRRALEQLDD